MKSKFLVPICLIMALLILVIGMTTVSFSWFEPDVKAGVGLQFSDEAKLRAENCSLKTYSGTMSSNGTVVYSDKAVEGGNMTVSANGIAYYKTVIKNENKEKDTVVSLYLQAFTVNSGSASLGVAVPTNSYRTFSATQNDLHIIRNAHISYLIQNQASTGELVVEWFVKCGEGSSVTFNPSTLYIMYN